MTATERSGNFTKQTHTMPSENLASKAKSKLVYDIQSNIKALDEQQRVEALLRALKLKEKERRLSQKRSKKWGRKKKKNRLSKKLKKDRQFSLPPDGINERDNEIKQPRSSKAKKLRKEKKRAKRKRATRLKNKRSKSLQAPAVFVQGTLIPKSKLRTIMPSSRVLDVKGSVHPNLVKKVPVSIANKTNLVPMMVQGGLGSENAERSSRPLKSVMKNPSSMYHIDPLEVTGPTGRVNREKLTRESRISNAAEVSQSNVWQPISPWGSYGNGKQLDFLETGGPFRPAPTGLLGITDNGDIPYNDGLASVLQPIWSKMEGFTDSTAQMLPSWDVEELHPQMTVGKRSLSPTTVKPRVVLPGQGKAGGKFPKTEAILQMETRTLSKLQKSHKVRELPSSLKHVKPLIGVTSNKDSKLLSKRVKIAKDLGRKLHAPLRAEQNLTNVSQTPLESAIILPTLKANETNAATSDRAVYIANLTENYLATKNYSWPPQVNHSAPLEILGTLKLPHMQNRMHGTWRENLTDSTSPTYTSYRKFRRNANYRPKVKIPEKVNKGVIKLREDIEPASSGKLASLIDEYKYPFYFASSSERVAKYSPLRYAINPAEIPVKTGGGMEFYESREKYRRCKDVQPPEDPVPDRPADGQWVQNTDGPDGPRISGLGEVISCLREKLFGKEPLDNPFFLETKVGLPSDTAIIGSLADEAGAPEPSYTDQFDFFKDILRQIDNTALRPLAGEVTDNPYVYKGSKSPSESAEAQRYSVLNEKPQYHRFNLPNGKVPNIDYNKLNIVQELTDKLAPKDVSENGGESQGSQSRELGDVEQPRQEPRANQQFFYPSVPDPNMATHNHQQYISQPIPEHNLAAVDPHTPFQMSEDSKRYLDEVLNTLASQRESKEGGRSQTDAQETTYRIAQSDSIYQPIRASKMHPPPLTTFKYKPKYTDSLRPALHLGPNSHEQLLSWPKAQYVLRDTGPIHEVFETSESKDPVRSMLDANPAQTFYEQKEILSGETHLHSNVYKFNEPGNAKEEKAVPHPSKTAEIVKQKPVIKDPQPTAAATAEATSAATAAPPTEKPKQDSTPADVHEPSASVITPLSTSQPPRLPEPIYHAVRGVGGIKTYHVGMEDDSVIEIPTQQTPPQFQWHYKPEEQTSGTEGSAQQSDEKEPQASNEPDPQEDHAPEEENNNEDDEKNNNDSNKDDNTSGQDDNKDDGDPNQNDDNEPDDTKKNDDNTSDANKNDDNVSDHNKNDDKSEANKNDDNQSDADKNDDNQSDANKNDENQSDGNKNDENGSEAQKEEEKPEEDEDAKNEETPENNDNAEEEDDKSNNNGKPDFDDWFKGSPYKVNDENDYNIDWEDSRPKLHVPFSKEWHKELGGINDEFKDDKDDDEDGVDKHVENLFGDDKAHDAYPDINTEPPAAVSGEGDQDDGKEAENQEASQQEPQKKTSDEDSKDPSEEAPDDKLKDEKQEKDKGSATEETLENAGDEKKNPKEDDENDSNAAYENISPMEDEKPKPKPKESEEPRSNEEPASAEEPKKWESGELPRKSKKARGSAQDDIPSLESGGVGNFEGYNPAAYEKPGDENGPSAEAHSGAEESKQSPKKTKAFNTFWSDNDDFGAPPGAKIRVVEHDASFGDIDDLDDDDDDVTSNGGKKITRRGKTPDNLSITTTNSRVRSKGFDTGINKRRATSHQKKARPVS